MRQRSAIGGVTLMVASSMILAAGGPAAFAAAGDSPTAAAQIAAAQHQDAEVPAGWTGNTSGCVVGTESQASLDATLSAINRLRAAAGTGPVSLDPSLNSKALAAAQMMAAQGALSHSPGSGWACYSDDGALAASRSNLYLGRSGAAAMLGYLHDEGVSSLGHRRWLLNPQTTVMGSGSTGESNALWVVSDGPKASVPASSLIAWPAAGHVADDWVPTVWSVAVAGPDDTVDVASLQVSMTRDGAPLAVSHFDAMPAGYGAGETIWWVPQLPEGLEAQTRLDVTISGVNVNGTPTPIAYSVVVVPWEPPRADPNPGPAPTPDPGRSNDPGGTTTQVVVRAGAVSRAGNLAVDVDPNLGKRNWTFTVHRLASNGKWRKVKTLRTKGKAETRRVNLPKGRYVVRVAGKYGYSSGESAVVTLLR